MSTVGEQMQETVRAYGMQFGLSDAFPVGLPVKDRDGRTGVVVGYDGPKVLVQETGIPTTETPPPVPLAPEHITPAHPRPTRYELLAAVEQALLRVARERSTVGAVESQAHALLALAQARALLESGR